MTSKKRFSNAMLRIDVNGNENHFAPRLVAEALEGFVDENSPVGTPVISARRKGQPLQLKIVEEDLVFPVVYAQLLDVQYIKEFIYLFYFIFFSFLFFIYRRHVRRNLRIHFLSMILS